MVTTNLHRRRIDKGYTQRKLSALSGISMHTINKYEQRTRPIENASLAALLALAEALEVPIYKIIDDVSMANRLQRVEKDGVHLL